ncbi:MAG: CDGSH iron-sulfur domain-containing protein, partial [Nitrospira sp.]|nr:CDGSH iron-sulfur domain-containing protein [Nitrospira sp.]
MVASFKIKVSRNGPYIVSGGIPLEENIIVSDAEGVSYEWKVGRKFRVKDKYRLCRCGQSKDKPFCDGTHTRIQFNGTEKAGHNSYLERAKKINGPDLDLTDVVNLCVHARFCDRAGGIWKLIKHSDDPRWRKIAIEEARDCPSGRLVVWDKAGNEIEPEFQSVIALVEDPPKGVSGPLWIRGCIPIESADGIIYEIRNRVTLCRC